MLELQIGICITLFYILNGIYCFWGVRKIRSSNEVKSYSLISPVSGKTIREAYSDNKKIDAIIVSLELLLPVEFFMTAAVIVAWCV